MGDASYYSFDDLLPSSPLLTPSKPDYSCTKPEKELVHLSRQAAREDFLGLFSHNRDPNLLLGDASGELYGNKDIARIYQELDETVLQRSQSVPLSPEVPRQSSNRDDHGNDAAASSLLPAAISDTDSIETVTSSASPHTTGDSNNTSPTATDYPTPAVGKTPLSLELSEQLSDAQPPFLVSAVPNRRKWDLPMLLNGREVAACPDSGSSANIILEDTVQLLGLQEEADTAYSECFTLGNGKLVESIGRVSVECRFARDPSMVMTCVFHVFSKLIVPLIMGAGFLRETATLTNHRDRLRERSLDAGLPLKVMHINGTKEHFRCYINSKERLAAADTGSEMDLVSGRFARQSPYREMTLEKKAEIQFADGSIELVSTQVFSQFTPHVDLKWSPKWFYVLDGLSCDVLLGEQTLEQLRAFDDATSGVVTQQDAFGFALNIISWLRAPEEKASNLFRSFSKLLGRKRGKPTDEETDATRVFFSSPALQGIDRRFLKWLRDSDVSPVVNRDSVDQLPSSITEGQLLELDTWELNRRELQHVNDATDSEIERRETYERCRSIVMNAIHTNPNVSPRPTNNYRSRRAIDSPDSSGESGDATSSDNESLEYATPLNLAGPSETFQCNHPGCDAPPFQTLYLLRSHAEVHDPNLKPHYCPVSGCPRSYGGKGFKRKNEMIRHGLVHDAPGYVCPFCPDQMHKYPRPDNLQRHVRVHHVDKDRDDPELRQVLAQRPEGSTSRGRRRRHGIA